MWRQQPPAAPPAGRRDWTSAREIRCSDSEWRAGRARFHSSSAVQPAPWRARDSRARLSHMRELLPQNQRQAILRISYHHYFRVRTLRQGLSGLDALPFEQRGRNALGDDLLEVTNAGG